MEIISRFYFIVIMNNEMLKSNDKHYYYLSYTNRCNIWLKKKKTKQNTKVFLCQ